MRQALGEARCAFAEGVIPVGALVVDTTGTVVALARNRDNLPTEHAEILAINDACAKLKLNKLRGFTLYTTLEPCIMCSGAILNSQISRVVFGAWDSKFGAAGSVWDILRDPASPHHPETLGGVLEDECSTLLTRFFFALRRAE
ncbi:MAG: nucleoside deaminase [Candidatus Ancillula sp.]|nr:nucleoside deaminase [Candidatus Ancillula sp.]